MNIKNKVVMVTGGAQGIGRATVLKFVKEGAKVSWCDLNEEASLELLKEVGEEHCFFAVNVKKAPAVREWAKEVFDRYGKIDVLVNNAGITRDNFLVKVKNGELVKEMPDQDFSDVIDINLKGVFHCTQAVAPYMIRQKKGVILSASSVVGSYGNLGQTNYAAAKAGVVGMTKVWAREFGRHNVRVNTVSPGFIETDMVKAVPAKVVEQMCAQTPLQRLGQPEEIANIYCWLASDEASFITGTNIAADGGLVLGT